MELGANKVISTILKHDRKVTSYKIALLRAINDVVLSFPDVWAFQQDVAVPLRLLAEYWVAYYWPFVAPDSPIYQGQRANGKNDMGFRAELTQFRAEWEQFNGELSRPADGFYILNELRIPRRRASYPASLLGAYQKAIRAIAKTLEMPIRYAGPGNWTVFEEPKRYDQLSDSIPAWLNQRIIPVPGTQPQDKCLLISAKLWQTFQGMSLWVEALCIHEWCLFSERIMQEQPNLDRGDIYTLLTDRPDNRRPLTWESNQIDLLLMEGHEFVCPWTNKRIVEGTAYDLDHLLPVSIYPINELWNLVPSDPGFNRHVKRDRLPSPERLAEARPRLERDYEGYGASATLAQTLQEDVSIRFSTLDAAPSRFSEAVAVVVVGLMEQVAESRNWERF